MCDQVSVTTIGTFGTFGKIGIRHSTIGTGIVIIATKHFGRVKHWLVVGLPQIPPYSFTKILVHLQPSGLGISCVERAVHCS